MKRSAIILVAVILVMSMLAGCGTTPAPTGAAPTAVAPAPAATAAPAAPTGAPATAAPVELTIWSGIPSKIADQIKDFNDIISFKDWAEHANVTIKWIHPPVGQETDQFNLLIAGGDLPDLVFHSWRTVAGGPEKQINDNVIIKLNDLIASDGPAYSKLLADNPSIARQAMTDNGSHYMMPFIRGDLVPGWPNGDPRQNFFSGFQLRKDWLDKLGMALPESVEDWEKVFAAVHETDLNGNGANDEIPFLSDKMGTINNWASAWGILSGYYLDGGKVSYGPLQPAYKDWITKMAEWYGKGYIDPDFMANDGKSFAAKITGGQAFSYVGSLGGNFGTFTMAMKDVDPNFKLSGALWPLGPAGKRLTAQGGVNHAVTDSGIAFTTANKHPVESMRLVDYGYSVEGAELLNLGHKGEHFTGDGNDVKYTDLILEKTKTLSIDQAMATVAIGGTNGFATIQDPRLNKLNRTVPGQYNLPLDFWGVSEVSLILPPITPSTDEAQEYAEIMSEVNTYVTETVSKIIMGTEPLSKLDEIPAQLTKMKIERALEIQNAALTRFNNR